MLPVEPRMTTFRGRDAIGMTVIADAAWTWGETPHFKAGPGRGQGGPVVIMSRITSAFAEIPSLSRPNMEKKPQPPRRPDRKPNALTSNTVWVLLGVGVLTLVLLNLMSGGARVEFKYTDFVKLVQQHESKDQATPSETIASGDLIGLIDGKLIDVPAQEGPSRTSVFRPLPCRDPLATERLSPPRSAGRSRRTASPKPSRPASRSAEAGDAGRDQAASQPARHPAHAGRRLSHGPGHRKGQEISLQRPQGSCDRRL